MGSPGETRATTYKNYGYLSRPWAFSANFNIDNQENVLANARRNQLAEVVRSELVLTPD